MVPSSCNMIYWEEKIFLHISAITPLWYRIKYFRHVVVCSSIYGFQLHLWYLQTLLLNKALCSATGTHGISINADVKEENINKYLNSACICSFQTICSCFDFFFALHDIHKTLSNSNIASFFLFVDKRAIYRWYDNLIRTCAGEYDWLFHWQHKLCVTFSANVNINYRLPIKYTTVFVLLDISESK